MGNPGAISGARGIVRIDARQQFAKGVGRAHLGIDWLFRSAQPSRIMWATVRGDSFRPGNVNCGGDLWS